MKAFLITMFVLFIVSAATDTVAKPGQPRPARSSLAVLASLVINVALAIWCGRLLFAT